MKKKYRVKKQLGKKILAIGLAFAISIGSISFPSKVDAGMLTSLITKKFSAVAFELLERGVIYGLGEAANASQQEATTKALSTVKRLFSGPTGPALKGITEMCAATLEKVTIIQTSLNNSFQHIDEQLASIIDNQLKDAFNEKNDKARAFYEKYNDISNVYKDLISALEDYANDPSDINKSNLEIDYKKVEDFYTAQRDSKGTLDFKKDLDSFLGVISPYSYSQPISYDAQPFDSSKWGEKSDKIPTYLSTYYDVAVNSSPFEHQVYDEMTNAINQIACYVNTYMTALRLYTEFGVQSIGTDPNLEEDERKLQITQLWDDFNNNSYRAMRGLEQMISLYQDELSTYMRSYDFDLDNFAMDYHDENELVIYESPVFGGGHTEKWMSAYQVKPINSDVSYVVLKGSDSSDPNDNNICLTNDDLVSVAYYAYVDPWLQGDCRRLDLDYFNLIESTSPSNYTILENINQLQPILRSPAYSKAGQYLASFLSSQGMQNLPNITQSSVSNHSEGSLKQGAFLILRKYSPRWGFGVDHGDMDEDVSWINITQPLLLENPTQNQIKLDLEDDIVENSNVRSKQPLVILESEQPHIALKLTSNTGGTARLWNVDANGEAQSSVDNKVLDSAQRMMVKIKPYNGYTATSVTLNSVYNGYKVDLLNGGNLLSDDEQAVVAKDALDKLSKDEDGYYCLYFTTPYQDAVVDVTFAKDEENKIHTVTLDTASSQGELQFESINGISSTDYKAGENVIVYARSYEGNVVNNVTVTTAQNDSIKVIPLPLAKYRPTPNTMAYTFNMPNEDVTVTANYDSGYSVEISNSEEGTVSFAKTCLYADWLTHPVSYREGDWVVLKSNTDDKYFLSNYEIIGKETYDSIHAITVKDGIAFKMPAEDITITPEYTKKASGLYTVKKETTGQGIIQLYDDDKNPLYGTQFHYQAKQKVSFKVLPNNGCELIEDSLVVTDADNQPITVNKSEKESNKYSFKMPTSGNVTIHADFTPLGAVNVETIEGVEYNFINSYLPQDKNNAQYIFGREVRVALHDTPNAYVPENSIDVSYINEAGESVNVDFELDNVYSEQNVRVVKFIMPNVPNVTVSVKLADILRSIQFVTNFPYPITFDPMPVITGFDEYFFSNDTKNVKVKFNFVPEGSQIVGKMYNHTTNIEKDLTVSGDYTLDVPFDADKISIAYTTIFSNTLTVDSPAHMQVSLQSASRSVVPPSNTVNAQVPAFSTVNVQAVSSTDFEVQSTSDVKLQSAIQDANGNYIKVYQVSMKDKNVFTNFRTIQPDTYSMRYQYIDPSADNKSVVIEIQQVVKGELPSSVTAPQIDGYVLDRWVLPDGTTYNFEDKYTSDQVITAMYVEAETSPDTGDNSYMLLWSMIIVLSMTSICYIARRKEKNQ